MDTQITKKYALLLIVAVFCSIAVFAGEEDNYLEETKTSKVILDPFYSIDNPTELVTLKFYDFKDNLVYQATVSKEVGLDAKLAKYLNESDYLTNNSKTSYFRLNK
jgi:hypothetical protein